LRVIDNSGNPIRLAYEHPHFVLFVESDMRWRSTSLLSAAVSLGVASAVYAQVGSIPAPSVPGGTAPPSTLPTGIAPYPAMPGEPTIWSKLGVSASQREYRARQMCKTPGGQLIGKMVNPLSVLSGGLISPFCPTTPSLAELQDPGAIGAAAKVKQDRAGAEDRVKAVRYLGTVDCHYWPEAEDALIAALRVDRNECVRYEAAVILANGCCCTPKVMIALAAAVSCSQADDNPIEKSGRVRAAAANALDKCMASTCGTPCGPMPGVDPISPDPDPKKNTPKTSQRDDLTPTQRFYATVSKYPRDKVIAICRQALEVGAKIGYETREEINPTDYAAVGLPTGPQATVSREPRNLWDAFTRRGTPASIAAVPVSMPVTKTVLTTVEPARPMVSSAEFRANPAPILTPAPKPIIKPAPSSASMPTSLPAPIPTSTSTPAPVPVLQGQIIKPKPVAAPVLVPANVPAPISMNPTTPVITPKPTTKPIVMPAALPVVEKAPVKLAPVASVAPVEAPARTIVITPPNQSIPNAAALPRPIPVVPPEPTPLLSGYEVPR
jgi:hypothetical protein